jgi:hypothetical protein
MSSDAEAFHSLAFGASFFTLGAKFYFMSLRYSLGWIMQLNAPTDWFAASLRMLRSGVNEPVIVLR